LDQVFIFLAMARPNIIFILLDDLGWKDIGCYGSSFYETPHLDRLASEGIFFSDAYASCPVCSPTRASILTGKYPATVGVTQFIGGHTVGKVSDVPYFFNLPMQEISLARVLRERGKYQTWHVGKWHLGSRLTWPDNHGFDVNIGGCHWGYPIRGYFSPYGCPTLEDGPEGEYLTDRLTNEAINLIETAGDQPFFLNLWPYAVHIPIQAPETLIDKYRRKAKDLGIDHIDPFEEGDFFPCLHKKDLRIQRRTFQSDPAYAAMIENLDWNVGRLLGALEATGKADNTIVIFTSDNGGLATAEGSPTCNHPLAEGKGWMYEGGTREPLFIRWPGVIKPGSKTSIPVTSPDFYPTLLEAAKLDPMPEQHTDGVSLLPLLQGESLDRGPIFWHYPHYSNQGGTPGCSVRDGDWKLIEFFEDNHIELYNLREDISEEKNLAMKEKELAIELKGKLDEWKISVEAKIPKRNPNYYLFEDH
jgi:arylsulfatase A-like enzyme